MPRALITGLTGQDGSYLAELLLDEGYEVHGVVRGDDLGCSAHLRERVELHRGDLLAPDTLADAVARAEPDELYHLAAPSFVPDSWRDPAATMAAVAVGTAALLRAARDAPDPPRVFVAGSGEVFGAAQTSPQSETTPMRPSNPYGAAKLAAHHLTGVLRARGLHASVGILFNHESPRRPESFVTRKVTRAAAAIRLGLEREVALGSLDAVRDWSHAADVMRGAWLMLQREEPDDYVLASGTGRTIRELLATAFAQVGLDPEEHVRIDERFVRPPDPVPRVGDPSRARERLGWTPERSFEALVAEMVEADLRELSATGVRGPRRP